MQFIRSFYCSKYFPSLSLYGLVMNDSCKLSICIYSIKLQFECMDTTPLQHVDVFVLSLYRQKKNGRLNGEYACCHKLIFHLLDEKKKMLN